MAKKKKKASTKATEKTAPTVDETPDIDDDWDDETVGAETAEMETATEPPSKPSPTKNVEASRSLTRMPGKLRKTL